MDDAQELQNRFQRKQSAVLLLDCHEDMFGPENAFKMVLEACIMYYDRMLSNKSGKNYLIVLLAHHDTNKQVLIQTTVTLEAYQTLHDLLKLSADQLKTRYAIKEEPFYPHLVRSMKLIQNFDMVLYATTRSNPTIDEADRRKALLNVESMKLMPIRFKVLPLTDSLDFSVFFDEVYQVLEEKTSYYYYELGNLCEAIAESIHYKELLMTTNLYPYAGCSTPLRVEKYNVRSRPSNKTPVKIHKETLEVLQKRELPMEEDAGNHYYIPLTVGARPQVKITTDNYRALGQLPGIQLGITLLEARSQESGAYSINGFSSHPMELLRATKKTTELFNEFWEAMRDLYILCLCKLTRAGRAYNVELTPVKIREERLFEMRFIPPNTQLHISIGMDPYVRLDVPELDTLKPQLPQLDELIEEFTIEDFDSIMAKLVVPETAKVNEYVKKQLLHQAYTPKEVTPYKDVVWYKGNTDKINSLCAQMEGKSIKESGTKRRR